MAWRLNATFIAICAPPFPLKSNIESFIKAVMAPATCFIAAVFAGRCGVTDGLPVCGLQLPDKPSLQAIRSDMFHVRSLRSAFELSEVKITVKYMRGIYAKWPMEGSIYFGAGNRYADVGACPAVCRLKVCKRLGRRLYS